MSKKRSGDNPMPPEVYDFMTRFLPHDGRTGKIDLHHCLVDKHNVEGMPLWVRRGIHHPCNLWWERAEDHASHANIKTKQEYYRLLCQRWGKEAVDEFVNSFHWKSTPPVTVEWLESEE
jgi:hypothetical protein